MTYEQIKTKIEKFTTKNYKAETDKDGKEYFLVPSRLHFFARGAEARFPREASYNFFLSESSQTISFRSDTQEKIHEGILLMSEISGAEIEYDKVYKQVIEGPDSTITEA